MSVFELRNLSKEFTCFRGMRMWFGSLTQSIFIRYIFNSETLEYSLVLLATDIP